MIHSERPGRLLSISGSGKMPLYFPIYHLNLAITFVSISTNVYKLNFLKEQCGIESKLLAVHFFRCKFTFPFNGILKEPLIATC
jgi:hypothetical protein